MFFHTNTVLEFLQFFKGLSSYEISLWPNDSFFQGSALMQVAKPLAPMAVCLPMKPPYAFF
jgi:hypothetical protein